MEDTFLLIGIMSARDNFEARDSIRKTWIQMVNVSEEKYLFVVGADFCTIPPSDRISKYSCQEWNVTVPKGLTETTEFHSSKLDDTSSNHIHSELTFETHHSIIIRRFCVLSNFIKMRLQITLIDNASEENVLSATFVKTDDNVKIVCKSVEAFSFPANFEGKIVIKNTTLPILQIEDCMRLTDNSQIISYRRNSANSSDQFCVPFSFTYTLQDTSLLLNHLANKQDRLRNWTLLQHVNNDKLNIESNTYNDILFVNVVDVYRNLPRKLLHFLTWSAKHLNFKYLLKTDDDTFINLKLVQEKLKTESGSHRWWWSSFREMWPVQKYGKWREEDYRSITYPRFPCGAGYVLSADLVQFLTKIADQLHCYQGEDVSIGIWLSPFNPNSANSCWECDKCVHEACNVPQLTVNQMYQTWDRLIQFNQLCDH